MQLKYIEFVFENCECFKIDGRYIGRLWLEDFKKEIFREGVNSFANVQTVGSFAIEINAKADEEYCPLGVEEKKTYKFNRLQFPDIVWIEFVLVDNDEKEEFHRYAVEWEGDDEYQNDLQETFLSEKDNLYIVISKTRAFDEYFGSKDILNKMDPLYLRLTEKFYDE